MACCYLTLVLAGCCSEHGCGDVDATGFAISRKKKNVANKKNVCLTKILIFLEVNYWKLL
jgi:hypothetical protein